MTTQDPPTHIIIPASTELQRRVGTGRVPKALIQAAQIALDQPRGDFKPVATPWLDALDKTLNNEPQGAAELRQFLTDLTGPIMELKANGKFFGYDLITDLAGLMLGFLESLTTFNLDARDILEAHVQSLRGLVDRRVMGPGGTTGATLVRELKNAIARYYRKYPRVNQTTRSSKS